MSLDHAGFKRKLQVWLSRAAVWLFKRIDDLAASVVASSGARALYSGNVVTRFGA